MTNEQTVTQVRYESSPTWLNVWNLTVSAAESDRMIVEYRLENGETITKGTAQT